jgi:dolichyl-phosphate beta-glucosyltransferase
MFQHWRLSRQRHTEQAGRPSLQVSHGSPYQTDARRRPSQFAGEDGEMAGLRPNNLEREPDPTSGRAKIHVPPRSPVDLEIVVPAFNEERSIGASVRAMLDYLGRQGYRSALVVVDNGSVDGTADTVAKLEESGPVTLHLINCGRRGKGAAVRHGVMTSNARYVGFSDADLATPIETLDTVWPLLEVGAPIVIGSRRTPGARYVQTQPMSRRLGALGFRLLTSLVLPGVADTQCGFKFFQRPVAQELFSRTTVDRFAFDVELLALASERGVPIHEIPVQWSEREGSTFRPLRDGLASAKDVIRVAARIRRRPPREIASEFGGYQL